MVLDISRRWLELRDKEFQIKHHSKTECSWFYKRKRGSGLSKSKWFSVPWIFLESFTMPKGIKSPQSMGDAAQHFLVTLMIAPPFYRAI